MDSVSSTLRSWPMLPLVVTYVISVLAIITFIYARRASRARFFARRDQCAYLVRLNWEAIVSGDTQVASWRTNPLQREVVETMLLDKISVAEPAELPALLTFLRSSGLLDRRLHQARWNKRWQRKTALIALGQTRAPEAVRPLLEALDSPDLDFRTAAVRGLGAVAGIEAAVPILERLSAGELQVAPATVSTALVSCCQSSPSTVLRYLLLADGSSRELLARVLAECDLEALGEELISLARDSNPEIRACAARGLSKLEPTLAVPILTDLAVDAIWFVRLRAVVALGHIDTPGSTNALLEALCDSHRLVRQRAGASLARRSAEINEILSQAAGLNDSYGMQALVSEMERTGKSEPVLRELRLRGNAPLGKAILSAREQLKLARAGAS